MKDFVIVQEHNYNDNVACCNAVFCKSQGISYHPYDYAMSILTLEIMKPHRSDSTGKDHHPFRSKWASSTRKTRDLLQ